MNSSDFYILYLHLSNQKAIGRGLWRQRRVEGPRLGCRIGAPATASQKVLTTGSVQELPDRRLPPDLPRLSLVKEQSNYRSIKGLEGGSSGQLALFKQQVFDSQGVPLRKQAFTLMAFGGLQKTLESLELRSSLEKGVFFDGLTPSFGQSALTTTIFQTTKLRAIITSGLQRDSPDRRSSSRAGSFPQHLPLLPLIKHRILSQSFKANYLGHLKACWTAQGGYLFEEESGRIGVSKQVASRSCQITDIPAGALPGGAKPAYCTREDHLISLSSWAAIAPLPELVSRDKSVWKLTRHSRGKPEGSSTTPVRPPIEKSQSNRKFGFLKKEFSATQADCRMTGFLTAGWLLETIRDELGAGGNSNIKRVLNKIFLLTHSLYLNAPSALRGTRGEQHPVSPIKGLRLTFSGRFGGKKGMAKTLTRTTGRVPLSTLTEKVDFAKDVIHTKIGSLGVKVWICYS